MQKGLLLALWMHTALAAALVPRQPSRVVTAALTRVVGTATATPSVLENPPFDQFNATTDDLENDSEPVGGAEVGEDREIFAWKNGLNVVVMTPPYPRRLGYTRIQNTLTLAAQDLSTKPSATYPQSSYVSRQAGKDDFWLENISQDPQPGSDALSYGAIRSLILDVLLPRNEKMRDEGGHFLEFSFDVDRPRPGPHPPVAWGAVYPHFGSANKGASNQTVTFT